MPIGVLSSYGAPINDNTALTTYFYIVRAVLSQTHPLFLPYLIGTVSVLKMDIKGGRLPHSMREMSTR